jgi:hypothetical protein
MPVRLLLSFTILSTLILPGCGDGQASQPHPPHAGAVPPSHPTPRSPFFSQSSFWNAPLGSHARLDPRSRAMVAGLDSEVRSELARNFGPWINTRQYSTPIYRVGPGQRRVHVSLNRDLPAMQAAIDAVPIPRDARPAAGSDHHMVVWQPSSDKLWEFWKMRRRRDGWHASAAGAIRNVSKAPGHYTRHSWPGAEPWWGATATGLPLVGGLMSTGELRRGRIDHALAIAIPDPRAGVWSAPATHGDGVSADPRALPEGARLRLDPKLKIGSLELAPITRMIAKAAQRYGIVVRDRAPIVTFYGQDPTGGSDPYKSLFGNQTPAGLLARFPWGKLEVLKTHLRGPGAPG